MNRKCINKKYLIALPFVLLFIMCLHYLTVMTFAIIFFGFKSYFNDFAAWYIKSTFLTVAIGVPLLSLYGCYRLFRKFKHIPVLNVYFVNFKSVRICFIIFLLMDIAFVFLAPYYLKISFFEFIAYIGFCSLSPIYVFFLIFSGIDYYKMKYINQQ